MSKVQRREQLKVNSSASVAVNSFEFAINGNDWDVQFVAPAALCTMQGSNDKLNWNTMNDLAGVAITALGSVQRAGLERPKWLRMVVGIDASGPRLFTAILNVQTRSHGS